MPLSIENRKIPNSLKNLNLPLSNDLYNNPKWQQKSNSFNAKNNF